MSHETKEGHGIGIADVCAVYGCAGCQACAPVRDAERDALRAEVETLRRERDDYRSQAYRYHADMLTVRDQRDEARAEAQRANEGSALLLEANTEYHAEVERLRAAMNHAHMGITLALQVREDIELRGALEEIEAALASAPPAKPSALDAAIEAWRGLREGHRAELCRVLDRLAANHDDFDGGAYMPDVAEDYRTAADLLRAAAVKP